MTPETIFYKSLITKFPKHWHWQRIETTTASGVPDLNVFIPTRGEVWLELKAASSPVIRSAQNAWIKKRQLLGGNVIIVLKTGDQIKMWDSPDFQIKKTGSPNRLMIVSEPNYTTDLKHFVSVLNFSIDTKMHKNKPIDKDE